MGGNIPYDATTGVYTLSANKTYMMQAQLRVSTASTAAAYLAYTWVDAINNTELITNSEALSSSNTSGAGFGSKDVVQIIYTPSTNQTVKLRSITSVGTQTIWLGTASIVQIGSSAIINPWVLSGNDVYNTTGKVGIGTNAPSQALDVTGTGKFSTSIINSGNRSYFGKDGSNMHWFGTTDVVGEPWNLGYGIEANAGILSHRWNTLGVERMKLNSNGYLGIGNTTPADMLVVGGSVSIHDGGDKVIGFGWSPGSSKAIVAGQPAEIRLEPGLGKLSFGTDATARAVGATVSLQKRMSITSQGNVGIGTDAPNSKLHVLTSDATSVYIQSNTSDNNGMLILNANTNQNWGNNWHELIMFQKQGNTIGHITGGSNGSAVTYSTTSDYRLKKDLKNYSGLDLVNRIKTYDYAWKSDNARMYGVMAHELQEVLPYMVSGKKDAVDVNGKIIPQAVDYSKLTPILVKAIQEQDAKIKEQQKQIDEIKSKLK